MSSHKITDSEIEKAKSKTQYSLIEYPLHEHNDCIKICYEWLDVQKTTKNTQSNTFPIKHYIERWAGRYVSQFDVDVALTLHKKYRGNYWKFNMSKMLIFPTITRLKKIGEALTQMDYTDQNIRPFMEGHYKFFEQPNGKIILIKGFEDEYMDFYKAVEKCYQDIKKENINIKE